MKLRDVIHKEEPFDDERYSAWSNRFELFDKLGRNLNQFKIEKIPNYLDIDVLEVKEGGYIGYGVGFPVTHIKLNFLNNEYLGCCSSIKYGGTYVDSRE